MFQRQEGQKAAHKVLPHSTRVVELLRAHHLPDRPAGMDTVDPYVPSPGCGKPWDIRLGSGKYGKILDLLKKIISVLGNNGTYEIIENLRSLQSIWHE